MRSDQYRPLSPMDKVLAHAPGQEFGQGAKPPPPDHDQINVLALSRPLQLFSRPSVPEDLAIADARVPQRRAPLRLESLLHTLASRLLEGADFATDPHRRASTHGGQHGIGKL